MSRAAALVVAAFCLTAAACKDSTSIPHTPTHIIIVSGSGQSGDLSAKLPQPLVVQALDGANKPVSGVPIAWTVTGGGTVSTATSTTDNDGKASVDWTLSANSGVQVVTATSGQITGVSVSFLANNGGVISGSVSAIGGLPFGGSLQRSVPAQAQRSPLAPVHSAPIVRDRIVVGFRETALGVAAAGSVAYRSLATARATDARLRQHALALVQKQPVSAIETSPSMLAARMRVDDVARIDEVIAALRADPTVAYVERDAIVTIRGDVTKPVSPVGLPLTATAAATRGVTTVLPNDPGFYVQYWQYNMMDLPRAWALTTGSANVIVAVVDQGIRFDHPDVTANLTNDGYDFVSNTTFTPPEPICGGGTFNSLDGDGDGADPDPTDPDDLEFNDSLGCWDHSTIGDHGLWTAGIIGAVGNDGVGVTGVNWTVRIRPIRALGITGDGSSFDIAQGILYAAGLAARGAGGAMVQPPTPAPIINLSLGGFSANSTLRAAVAAAASAGSLVIASAGNFTTDIETFPAALPNVMGVAAVGQDGIIASYSNGGTYVSVAAPGGEYRLDDNGGGGIYGLWWNYAVNRPTYYPAYGTSAAAPHVAGVAALILAANPGMNAVTLRQRLEQYATRPFGASRTDNLGWGIVNAYNSLTQQNGPARKTIVRLIDAAGNATRTTTVSSSGLFTFTRVTAGTYTVQAGDDEAGDNVIGVPGRRFNWFGGFGKPTPVTVSADQSQAIAIPLGMPVEMEPNDDNASANVLTVGSYVIGSLTPPDSRDVYSVTIPTTGQYVFETSGVVGTCGAGIEVNTVLTVQSSTGTLVGSNDNFTSPTGRYCSRVTVSLLAGTYYATVTASSANFAGRGRYRLEVRNAP